MISKALQDVSEDFRRVSDMWICYGGVTQDFSRILVGFRCVIWDPRECEGHFDDFRRISDTLQRLYTDVSRGFAKNPPKSG